MEQNRQLSGSGSPHSLQFCSLLFNWRHPFDRSWSTWKISSAAFQSFTFGPIKLPAIRAAIG
jgi:hypothetical protein